MTVASDLDRVSFVGNGVTTSFGTTPMEFFASSELAVYIVTIATGGSSLLVEGTHYTVSGGGTAAAVGTVDMTGGSAPYGAPPSTVDVLIVRTVPYTQSDQYINNDINDATVHEAAHDKMVMMSQQLDAQIGRSIRQPTTDVAAISALPAAVSRASKVLGFDAAGDVTTYSPASAVTDASSVAFTQSGIGAVARTVQAKERDIVSVKDFGVVLDNTTDDTTNYQAAITACQSSGAALYHPTGTAKTTASLAITKAIKLYGDGNQRSIISLNTASTSTFALTVTCANNDSIIGLDIGGIGITGNAGSASGSGINISTGTTNSAMSHSTLHDIYIKSVTTGVQIDNYVYMCKFRGITVTTAVASYGWYVPNTNSNVLYNDFEDLEVTAVASSGYAYYINTAGSTLKNLTADACCYFNGAYTVIDGLSIEGISATTPASTYAIQYLNIASMRGVAIINVPNSKCTYCIDAQGSVINVSDVRVPDSGAGNQPGKFILLHSGNTGTISNVEFDRTITTKVDADLSDAILNGFVFTGCADVIDRGLVVEQGTWTPTYTSWTTNPTLIGAQYTRVGRQVTVTGYWHEGVSTAGCVIGGLPFTSNSTQGAAAYGGCSDTTIVLQGSVLPSSAQINNLPAQTLTGLYWQLTATYFV